MTETSYATLCIWCRWCPTDIAVMGYAIEHGYIDDRCTCGCPYRPNIRLVEPIS